MPPSAQLAENADRRTAARPGRHAMPVSPDASVWSQLSYTSNSSIGVMEWCSNGLWTVTSHALNYIVGWYPDITPLLHHFITPCTQGSLRVGLTIRPAIVPFSGRRWT